MNKTENIVVSIICNTYNHEPYIRQCLDGFVMQNTTFAFEVLIHDDASTDKTADIIREYEAKYSNIIKPIYQVENQYSKKIGIMKTFQYPRVRGKYMALCEGDDYWIDPLKLQKQVDFLEENPEYGLVHTNYKCYYQSNNTFKRNINKQDAEDERLENLLSQNTIATLTTCIRMDIFDRIPKYYLSETFRMGDYPMWIEMAAISKIKYMSEITSVYRVLESSASHYSDPECQMLFNRDSASIRKYYSDKYSYKKYSERAHEDILYWDSILKCIKKERLSSLLFYFKSKRVKIKDILRYFKYFMIG